MNKQQLANKIWASANKMRSKIDANEYKDYILGLSVVVGRKKTCQTSLKITKTRTWHLPLRTASVV